MIDAAGLLHDLRSLLDNCGVVEGLDKAIEYRSNTSRREALVEALDSIVQGLDDTYRRRTSTPLLAGEYLVRSQSNAMGASNLSLEPDVNLRMRLVSQGESWMDNVDSGVARYMYYGEFVERVTRLREEILKGKLDSILGLDPTQILHRISGLKGELLPAIDWDPVKGETYRRFTNDPLLNAMNGLEATHERRLKRITDSGKELTEMIKKYLPPPHSFPNNILVTNDYWVHPKTSRPEEVGKLGNIPEAKLNSEAEDGVVKLPTTLKLDEVRVYVHAIKTPQDKDPNISDQKNISEVPMVIPKHNILGIIAFTMNKEIAYRMGLEEETKGVLITDIFKNSIAEKAGFKVGTTPEVFDGRSGMLGGDIIISVDDQLINSNEELREYLSHYHVLGTQIKFRVLRNGEQIEIPLIY